MTTLNRTTRGSAAIDGFSAVVEAFAEETFMLLKALASPNKILGEVEQMRSLLTDAHAAEATDPARAAALRRRASRIGLR
ncbi:hypothetical protein QTI66_18740 [Variovorax sp. J22R133]|uniref:hypothetical protein n=1 Tax=Variovorax brevis TaxID=3053503 RepID=UPI0025749C6B|nr:hypothetical protein [Variovorax sp. J22R133]MDM0114198.1 hypothetical protein [Variovorax sp. J22R133]